MDYLCAHFWQQEESGSSLVLKHLVFHQGKVPVVLGCLAQGKGEGENQTDERRKTDMFVENLTEWFHQRGVGFSQREEEGIKELEGFWKKKLSKRTGELEGVAIVFCVGEHFVILAKGNIKIWLLNNRFGRGHHRELSSQMEQVNGLICKGTLEPGIGILLAEETFFGGLSETEILACLNPETLKTQVRVQKHLEELALESARRMEKHSTAMMIATC